MLHFMPIEDLLRLLERYRFASGESLTSAAGKAGCSRQALSRWEAGSAMPTVDALAALLDVYGVTWHQLADDLEPLPDREPDVVPADLYRKLEELVDVLKKG